MDEKELTQEETSGTLQDERAQGLNTDDSIAGTVDVEEKVPTDTELDKLRSQIQEKEDKYLRLYAEFDNFKRRNAKERIELIQTAGREVIQSLLEVLDDCDRAEKQMINTEDIVQVREGVQLVFNKLRKTMQSKGLKEMSSIGEVFNADIHEAITELPVAEAEKMGKVIDEVEKGYFLNDKIIRFAKVVVGKQS